MDVRDVAVGLPVGDLARAVAWYQRVFDLGEPDLEPTEGIVEFRVGPVWLQLGVGETARSGAEVVTSFGVEDAGAERARLVGLGLTVGPLEHVEGAVDYVEFADPDGNLLSIHSEVGRSPER